MKKYDILLFSLKNSDRQVCLKRVRILKVKEVLGRNIEQRIREMGAESATSVALCIKEVRREGKGRAGEGGGLRRKERQKLFKQQQQRDLLQSEKEPISGNRRLMIG